MPAATYCTKLDGAGMNEEGVRPNLGVFDADGNMYFVVGNTVKKMAQNGFGALSNCTTTTFNSSALLKSPNGESIGMDAAGNIYVSNNHATDKSVIRISADGTTAETYLTTQQTGNTLNGIIFDSDQNLLGYQNVLVGFGVHLVRFANITKTKTSVITLNNQIMPDLGGNKTITGVSLNAFDDIFLSISSNGYSGNNYLVKFDHTFVQQEAAVCNGACTQAQIDQNKSYLIYDSTGSLWPSKYPPTVKFLANFESYTDTRASVVDSEGNTWVPQTLERRLLKLNDDGEPLLSTRTGTAALDNDPFQYPAMKIDPAGNIWILVTNGTWAWAKLPGATKPFLRQLTYKGIGSTPYRAGKTAQIQLDGSTGAVAFKTTNVGDISVSPAGTLTASSALEPGKYTVSGTALDSANTAGTWTYTLTVTKDQPTVSLASSANPSIVQDSVTYTATPSAFDSGTVITFKDGATTFGTCTVTLVSCSYTDSSLGAGSRSITAVSAESAHYLTATSNTVTQSIGTISTGATWSVSNNPTQGQTITFTANVLPAAATGTVAFKDSNNNTLCTTGNLVSGTATCDWSGNPTRGS
jgi:hypothetical protein